MKRFRLRLTQRKLFSLVLAPLILLLALNLTPHFSVKEQSDSQLSGIEAQYAQLPLAFEPNQGQVDDVVQYLVHHGQATTYFAGTDTVTSIGDEHITMSLNGATTQSFVGTDELPSKTNYFIGNDQSKWQSDVPNYQSILAKNVYPGIDLKYYGTNSQLEHDFIVSPGTDPQQIAFSFLGQKDLSLDANGNLVLKLENSELTLQAPISYQEAIDGGRKSVASSFELDENKSVKIALGDYDTTRPLVIDPVLIYSTYLGGTSAEIGQDITIDASGNAYITGVTQSTNFPTASPFQAANAGVDNVFITKLNATGSALVYSTYLGGSGSDQGNSIAVDLSGNAYITGFTNSTNFPMSAAFDATNSAVDSAFVTKLNAAGSALTYSTYLGGSAVDQGNDIAIDSSGNAYIIGFTISSDFPTSSPYQASFGGGAFDAFITKFNPSGSALTYSTYLGTLGSDNGYGIAVDASGNAYLLGDTSSAAFPTVGPFQAANAGGTSDLFVTKLNAAGSALTYSSYLGGSLTDVAGRIALDSSNNAYLTGYTTSTNFPTASPFQASHAGATYDSFVTKVNAAGSSLTYSTYLGGTGDDVAHNIAVDSTGNAYLIGETDSVNFPTSVPFQATYGGGFRDAFVTKLNAAGSALTYSTYLGGSAAEEGFGIGLDLSGDVFVAGETSSTNFPTSSPFQASNAGSLDVFVTQLSENTVVVSGTINPTLTFTVDSTSCSLGTLSISQTKFCTHTMTASTNGQSGYVISYIPVVTLTSGGDTIDAMATQTSSVLASEQFGINLKANTAAGSFTATDFGADPSGGSGVAVAAYSTANQFKLTAAGENVAQSTVASLLTTYTVSYIANIASNTEAGAYTSTLTYNIVAGY